MLKKIIRPKGAEREIGKQSNFKEKIPTNAKIIARTPRGTVFLHNGRLKITPANEDSWTMFNVLLLTSKISEIFVRRDIIIATLAQLGRVVVDEKIDIEEVIGKIIEETGVAVDLSTPFSQTEYLGWRIFIQIEPAGQLEITATRVSSIPRITKMMPELLVARILTLLFLPSTAVVIGPPGSGKSTLLNSLVAEVSMLWPQLHIAVVEPVKELVLKGGWAARMVGPVSELTRLTVRYKRPDILVIGELLTNDVWTFIEAGRSGIPTIATFHSPNIWKCLRSMADSMKMYLRDANERTVLRYIDLFIVSRKMIEGPKVTRYIDSVYLSDSQRLIPIYLHDLSRVFLPEEDFKDLLPENSMLGKTERLYGFLKKLYHVKTETYDFAEIKPIPVLTDLVAHTQV